MMAEGITKTSVPERERRREREEGGGRRGGKHAGDNSSGCVGTRETSAYENERGPCIGRFADIARIRDGIVASRRRRYGRSFAPRAQINFAKLLRQ